MILLDIYSYSSMLGCAVCTAHYKYKSDDATKARFALAIVRHLQVRAPAAPYPAGPVCVPRYQPWRRRSPCLRWSVSIH